MPPQPKPYKIAIIGGGIAGLSTAIGLLSAGIRTTIYESASAFSEIGAGVSFGPNAARAMSLINSSIYSGFQNCATNNAWAPNQKYWFSFRQGQGAKAGDRVADLECDTGQTSVHRARYLDGLIALVPEGVAVFGKRILEIEEVGEAVVLRFEDGVEVKHDAVIGCDGVKSRTRRILLGEDDMAAYPVFTGKYAFRGLIPMEEALRRVGEEAARNSQMYLGKDGHVLTFPIEKGKTMNGMYFPYTGAI